MASLIGTDTEKKIIIFSHKEIQYFQNTNVRKRWLLLFPLYLSLKIWKQARARFFAKKLNELSQKHLMGVHWGWKFENFKTPKYIDYHLSGKNTLKLNTHDKTPVLDYSSSTFLPSFFLQVVPYNERIYDIILVNRLAKFKNTDLFMSSVAKVLKERPKIKVLLVLPTELNESKKTHHDITDMLTAYVPDHLKKNILILRSDPRHAFLGFPREFVADLVARSRVLCLFSEGEGVAKVIKEAQSLGTKVVAFNQLSGGGLDFDNDLIFKFPDFENAHETIFKALDTKIECQGNYHSMVKATQMKTNEIHNLDLFKEDLKGLFFDKFQQPFDGTFDVEDLSRRLPNHCWDPKRMPWITNTTAQKTATDILAISVFRKFLSYV